MKKTKQSIKINLMFLTLLPILLLASILTTVASQKLKSTMMDDIKANLKTAVYSVLSTYCYGSSDKISLVNDDLKIGDSLMADNTSVVDTIKNLTDTDVTIFAKDTRVLSSIMDKSGNRIVNTKATSDVIDTVLNKGEDYYSDNTDIQGENYCGYYSPLKDANGNIVGMIFAGRPTSSVEEAKVQSAIFFCSIGIIITILTGIIVFIRSSKLVKSIKNAAHYLSDISTGDLNVTPNAKDKARKDEIGLLFTSAHELSESLKNIIGKIHEVSNYLISHSSELHEKSTDCLNNTSSVNFAMNDIATGAVSQAEHTKDASDKIVDIGSLINDITLSLENLNNNSNDIQKAEQEANLIIEDSHQYNEVTIDAVQKIGLQAEKTNEAAQKINEAIELITDIAEQTNLLSLNASIEAARAGEAGKGFAVVAEEIQKLADESTKSAQTIKDTIEELLVESDNTVSTMQEVEGAVNNQRQKIYETKNKFTAVSNGITNSIENITLINEKSINLEKNKDEIIDLLENLSSISEENAASTEETTASVNELSTTIENIAEATDKLTQLAIGLEQSIEVFKL